MTEPIRLACIVEGHGEEQALPTLLRRILSAHRPSLTLEIPRPLRVSRGKLLKEKELERAIELMARKVAPRGAVLVVIDADDDCAAQVGPRILARARAVRGDMPVGVVLAVREFESWFLAGARSLRGQRGLSPTLQPPDAVEAVRGAKEWLTKHRIDRRPYTETLDQAALAAQVSLDEAGSTPRAIAS